MLRGAYGIAVAGLEAGETFLYPAEEDWPLVRIAVDPDDGVDRGLVLEDDVAYYPDSPRGRVEVDRLAGVARFCGIEPRAADAIVHPRLGMLAAIYAQWLPERVAFHAAGFVSAGRAWAVVGERGAGKSTLMAALALAGFPVIGDDTLVLDGPLCLAGVRCLDLRPDAVAPLGLEEQVVRVRSGARDRLRLGNAPSHAPLGGWLFLTWSDELAVRALPTGERFARIGAAQGWHRRGVTDPARLLALAALPAWEVARPRSWMCLPELVDKIGELTA